MTRISQQPRIQQASIQQQNSVEKPAQQQTTAQSQTGIAHVAQELPPSTGTRTLPAQTDVKSLGQNKGMLAFVNARVGEKQGGGDVSSRFEAALKQHGAHVSHVAVDGGALNVTFKSMADFDRMRALFTSDRYGSISFEGTPVRWQTSQLPPGA